MKTDLLRLVCTTSVISNDVVIFTIRDRQYQIDESVVRADLNFPTGNLVNLPCDQELVTFFSNINNQGPLDLTKLSKINLVDEWICFFDTLIKVFANCTKTSFSNISSLLQYIGFAVANNQRINFSQLIWHTMVRRITVAKRDHGKSHKVQCYYPRFLSIILNHLLSPEHIALFDNSSFEVSQTINKKFFTRLNTSLKYTNIPVAVTPFMSNFINLPTIPQNVQLVEPQQPEQPPVDSSTQTDSSAQGQVSSPISGSHET